MSVRIRTRLRFTARMVAGLSILIITAAAQGFQNVDDWDIFELEGNPQDDPTLAGDDWTRYFPAGPPGGNATDKTFFTDPVGSADPTSFTQGSKDTEGIAEWQQPGPPPPDKDDIQNAMAAAYIVNNQLLLYFAADRTANNGDANIGLWFLQGNVSVNPAGGFTGAHVEGDIFVVAAFTSGGQTAEIDVYRWVGTDAAGGLVLISQTIGGATCTPSATGAHIACAISNTSPVPSPWSYTPKQGAANTYPTASFFEGGINVTALLAQAGVTDVPCISTFMVETRSSTALTSTLKDFVIGSFSLCDVDILKQCVNGRLTPDGTAFVYDVRGTVTNTGVGQLFDVTVTDTFPAGSTPPSATFNLGNLTTGQTKCWPNPDNCAEVFTFTSTNNGPTNNASVAAATFAGGPKVITDAATPAQCPVVPLNPSLTVTKVCSTDLTEIGGHLAVQVTFMGTVCNTGDIPLNNVTVTNDKPDSVPALFSLGTLAVGQCNVAYGPGTYLPSVAGPVLPGRYQFSDQVTATGTPSSGLCGGNPTCIATATATCPLCPEGTCPVPPPQ
jgi:hypothetical protein